MKLSNWAKQQGISYATAFRWFKSGKIPNSKQMDTGTILINDSIEFVEKKSNNIIYCRVSNWSRKNELNYQVTRCSEFCEAKGIEIHRTFKEIASGLNDNRKEFWRMLEAKPTLIIVENKDRLTRFGFNYIEKLLNRLGCEILVINETKEDEEDLLKDFVSIITSFCCRLYGLRRSKNKVNKIKQIINEKE